MHSFSRAVAHIFRSGGYSVGVQNTKFLTISQLVLLGHEVFNLSSLASSFNYS